MSRSKVLVFGIVAVIAAGLLWYLTAGEQDGGEEVTPAPVASEPAGATAEPAATETPTVTLSAGGFTPQTVTIEVGEAVRFVNHSGREAQVASNPHPVHTDLRGFDSGALANGGSYTFRFTKAGEWGFHDHENSSLTGTVIVE